MTTNRTTSAVPHREGLLRIDTIPKPFGLGFGARAQRVLFDACSTSVRRTFSVGEAVELVPEAFQVGLIWTIGSTRFPLDCQLDRHVPGWTHTPC